MATPAAVTVHWEEFKALGIEPRKLWSGMCLQHENDTRENLEALARESKDGTIRIIGCQDDAAVHTPMSVEDRFGTVYAFTHRIFGGTSLPRPRSSCAVPKGF